MDVCLVARIKECGDRVQPWIDTVGFIFTILIEADIALGGLAIALNIYLRGMRPPLDPTLISPSVSPRPATPQSQQSSSMTSGSSANAERKPPAFRPLKPLDLFFIFFNLTYIPMVVAFYLSSFFNTSSLLYALLMAARNCGVGLALTYYIYLILRSNHRPALSIQRICRFVLPALTFPILLQGTLDSFAGHLLDLLYAEGVALVKGPALKTPADTLKALGREFNANLSLYVVVRYISLGVLYANLVALSVLCIVALWATKSQLLELERNGLVPPKKQLLLGSGSHRPGKVARKWAFGTGNDGGLPHTNPKGLVFVLRLDSPEVSDDGRQVTSLRPHIGSMPTDRLRVLSPTPSSTSTIHSEPTSDSLYPPPAAVPAPPSAINAPSPSLLVSPHQAVPGAPHNSARGKPPHLAAVVKSLHWTRRQILWILAALLIAIFAGFASISLAVVGKQSPAVAMGAYFLQYGVTLFAGLVGNSLMLGRTVSRLAKRIRAEGWSAGYSVAAYTLIV
ncbi:hypothetical protein DFJ73DRAFT_817011 [Zopfochytrium polystomum]|nr:hypothetical protein DFJ73DRAFT_817011 [Zopfochytrium polystomum]